MHEQVLGDPVEIERVFVSSHYCKVGEELEVDAVVKGLGDSNGLGLEFWIETQSGKYEEIYDIKTKKISKRDETAYKAKMNVKEEDTIQ